MVAAGPLKNEELIGQQQQQTTLAEQTNGTTEARSERAGSGAAASVPHDILEDIGGGYDRILHNIVEEQRAARAGSGAEASGRTPVEAPTPPRARAARATQPTRAETLARRVELRAALRRESVTLAALRARAPAVVRAPELLSMTDGTPGSGAVEHKRVRDAEDPDSVLDTEDLFNEELEERLTAPGTIDPGGVQWHPPGGCMLRGDAWAARGTSGDCLEVARGRARFRFGHGGEAAVARFEHDFCPEAFGNYNSCLDNDKVQLLAAAEKESTAMRVIEWYDQQTDGPLRDWAHVYSPYGVIWKAGGAEIRPVFDASVSGLNDALAPWPFTLVQVEDILREMFEGCVLGCRDWRHGFYHCVVSEEHRKYMSFKSPVDGRIGRFRCLPFGIS